MTLEEMTLAPEHAYTKIKETFPNPHTRATTVSAVWKELKTLPQSDPNRCKWLEICKDARAGASRVYEENITSDRQKKGYIPLAHIEKLRDSLPEWSIERVLLGMYTHICPLRNDFHNLLVCHTDKCTGNYLILSQTNPHLVLQEYKTSKRYGQLEIPLPQQLVNDIKSSLRYHPRNFLFVQKNGEPYSSENSFGKWANTHLKKLLQNDSVSLTMLRHIYIMDKAVGAPAVERKRIAKNMGHSVGMQMGYEIDIDVGGKDKK